MAFLENLTDTNLWRIYGIFIFVTLVVIWFYSIDFMTNINFMCPNDSTMNLRRIFIIIIIGGLLTYYSTDSFASMESSKRRLVFVLAIFTFIYNIGALIYKKKNPC